MTTPAPSRSSLKGPPKSKDSLSKGVSFTDHDEEPSQEHESPSRSGPIHEGMNARAITPADPVTEERRKNGLQRVWGWNPVMVLENTGSVARDHLASERTWLAYIRTSIAISSAGVVLVQLFAIAASTTSSNDGERPSSAHIQQFARPLGAATVLIGLGVCLLGLYRYFAIQSSLIAGKFPTARLEVHTVSLLLGALTGVVFGILVAFPR